MKTYVELKCKTDKSWADQWAYTYVGVPGMHSLDFTSTSLRKFWNTFLRKWEITTPWNTVLKAWLCHSFLIQYILRYGCRFKSIILSMNVFKERLFSMSLIVGHYSKCHPKLEINLRKESRLSWSKRAALLFASFTNQKHFRSYSWVTSKWAGQSLQASHKFWMICCRPSFSLGALLLLLLLSRFSRVRLCATP